MLPRISDSSVNVICRKVEEVFLKRRKCWCKWRGGVLCSFEADRRKSGVEVGVVICERRSERKKFGVN